MDEQLRQYLDAKLADLDSKTDAKLADLEMRLAERIERSETSLLTAFHR